MTVVRVLFDIAIMKSMRIFAVQILQLPQFPAGCKVCLMAARWQFSFSQKQGLYSKRPCGWLDSSSEL